MKFLKRIFARRMEEADLNKQSLDAAEHYLSKKGGTGVPLDERMRMLNYTAHGFFMGVRWKEEKLGIDNEVKHAFRR